MAKRKAAKAKPEKSLVELAREIPPRKIPNFFDKASPECQEQLRELRAAYQAGQLPAHINGRFLYEEVIAKKFPGLCSDPTFRLWLAKRDY